jgi:hypothetical protein
MVMDLEWVRWRLNTKSQHYGAPNRGLTGTCSCRPALLGPLPAGRSASKAVRVVISGQNEITLDRGATRRGESPCWGNRDAQVPANFPSKNAWVS